MKLDRKRAALLGVSAVVLVVSLAAAADVAVRGRRMYVREHPAGEAGRRVVIVGREASGVGPPSADEFAYGANLRVQIDGATSKAQLYFLPPEGWTSTARGQRYTGSGADPVDEVLIDADGAQPARIRVVLRGDVGLALLTLVPPDPGSGGSVSLSGVADTYCVAFGGAAGGSIKANTAKLFRMREATANVACPRVPTISRPTPSPGRTAGMCVQVCAPTPPPTASPTPTPTATPEPCHTMCNVTPTPRATPVRSAPPPTPTATPCPTICS